MLPQEPEEAPVYESLEEVQMDDAPEMLNLTDFIFFLMTRLCIYGNTVAVQLHFF